MHMSRLTLDGTAEPVSRDQILRRERGQGNIMIEFRCVVTVSTPAVWLARENIKRLTPRPCINVEYSHGVVYMECTT